MFERFRNRSEETNGTVDRSGSTAVADRPAERDDATTDMGRTRARDEAAATRTRDEEAPTRTRPAGRGAVAAGAAGAGAGLATREHMRRARARQREEYGGINWGAAFFGWLVAIGLGALLVSILVAAGAAVGLTQNVTTTDAVSHAATLSLGGAIALVVVLAIAYYAGGYVAGRMSRFDGARQGAGAWVIGVVVTLLLAAAAAILGSQYNVLNQLNLPALPIGQDTMTTGGVIALAAAVVVTLLAAVIGGKAGERYHLRVDRVGFAD
jgi:amino acid transporter